MFVGIGRIADAILTLKFDKFLDPLPTKTIVYYHPDIIGIKEIFDEYVDTSTFEFVNDAEILVNNPQIELLDPWHKQQFIKLIAVDLCTDDDDNGDDPLPWLDARLIWLHIIFK